MGPVEPGEINGSSARYHWSGLPVVLHLILESKIFTLNRMFVFCFCDNSMGENNPRTWRKISKVLF
jgi:hypothetical protein